MQLRVISGRGAVAMSTELVSTEGLCKYFMIARKRIGGASKVLKAVDDVTVSVGYGESSAIVGESGSGKTTLGKTLIGIYKPTSGRVWLEGVEISNATGESMRRVRRSMQMVFQDPGSALNPRKRISAILELPLKLTLHLSRRERKERVRQLLERMDLPLYFAHRYPYALSGGQKQRVGIARALASEPKLIALDEPTAALDVSVQAKILKLLKEVRSERGMSYVYISHDLSVVHAMSEKVSVMYLGLVVEAAVTQDLFRRPLHPYTKALLSAIPVMTEEERGLIPAGITLKGDIPSPLAVPLGCRFFSRCQERRRICEREAPPLVQFGNGHEVRCHIYSGGSSEEGRLWEDE